MPTPKLGLPYIDQGQAQKEVTHNQALKFLDGLVQIVGQGPAPRQRRPAHLWKATAGSSRRERQASGRAGRTRSPSGRWRVGVILCRCRLGLLHRGGRRRRLCQQMPGSRCRC